MSHRTSLQTYLEAWNERDSSIRLDKLASVVHPGVQLFDPLAHMTGAVVIAKFIAKVHSSIAFDRLEFTSGFQKHEHGLWVRYGWGLWLQDQNRMESEGMDVVEFDKAGKIRQVISFAGKIPDKSQEE